MLLLHASARTCDANARVYGVVRTGEKHETFGGALSFVLCPLELRLLPSDKSGHQDSTKKTPLRRGSQGSAFLETHPPKHRINRFSFQLSFWHTAFPSEMETSQHVLKPCELFKKGQKMVDVPWVNWRRALPRQMLNQILWRLIKSYLNLRFDLKPFRKSPRQRYLFLMIIWSFSFGEI